MPLMETLDETEGFRNTDDPRSFAQCQRCIRQIVHTLTSISHAWKVRMNAPQRQLRDVS